MHKSSFGEIASSKKLRFLAIGFLNTIFGYTTYAGLLFVGFNYSVALLLATIFGVIFNYYNFVKLVFSGNRDRQAFRNYIIVYSLIYAMNVGLLWVLTKYFLLDPYVAQPICIPLSVSLSWFLMNYWVFRRISQ